jgi:hypothetical protein
LWDAVEGKETDAKKVKKAKAKIILCIEETNFVHIRDCKTAKEVWDSLKTTFEDTGLTNKISLLRTLITTRLEACANVEVPGEEAESALFVKRKNFQKKKFQPKKDDQRKCHYCDEAGHWIAECPKKKAKESNAGNKKKDDKKVFCSVFSAGATKPKEWYLDSGATSHMVNDKSVMKNFVSMKDSICSEQKYS